MRERDMLDSIVCRDSESESDAGGGQPLYP